MAGIEFRTLGTLDLRKADGSEVYSLLAQPKRLALLAYLCVAKPFGFHRRDTLLGLFWPEADEVRARTSLRSALHGIRHALGDAVLVARGDEEIAVDAAAIHCDARTVEELMAHQRIEEALDLYRGDFLSGFFIEDTAAFERWTRAERAHLKNLAACAAATLADRLDADGNHATAITYAQRAVEFDDHDERNTRRLIILHARSSNTAAALAAYANLEKELAREYGAEASAETRSLIAAVRAGELASSGVPQVTPAAKVNANPALPTSLQASHRTIRSPRWQSFFRNRQVILPTLAVAILALAGLIGQRAGAHNSIRDVRQKLTTSGNALMASLSPDGQFLAYVTQSGDSQRVVLLDVVGGTQRILQSLEGAIWSLEWSPDGTRIMLGGFARALVIPRLDTLSKSMGPRTGPQVLAYWLPDSGRFSLHQAGDRRVLLVNTRTQDTVPLPVPGSYTWLDEGEWSPTGRTFAVMTESDNPVTWEIRTVTIDSVTHVVLKDTVALGSPRWSRDGRFLYYARAANSIHRIAVDPNTGTPHGEPERVLGDLQMYPQRFGLVHFALSHDGKSLIYARGMRFSNIWLLTIDPGSGEIHARALTTGTIRRWSPTVSPDGAWLAFAQETPTGAELFKTPMSGGPVDQVTSGAYVHPESEIAWSPNGREIAFSAVRGGYARVWIARVEDGVTREIGGSASTSTGHLTWAPGKLIAYQTSNNRNIMLLDPATALERQLVKDSVSRAVHSPSYSPDGRRIAVFWYRGMHGISGMHVFDVTTSTFSRVGGLYPRGWAQDGKSIYFQWPQSPIVYRVDLRRPSVSAIALKPAFREAQCFPAGTKWPNAFVCAAFDFTSDIWKIDNY